MTENGLEKGVTRRGFLKRLGLIAAGTAATPFLKNLNFTDGTETPATTGSIPSLTPTPELKPSLTPTPEFSLAQRVELMGNPDFFTKLQGENTRKIITFQYDKKESAELKRYVHLNNLCGEAVLATIWKTFEYLNTGKVPDITITDISKMLGGLKFTDIRGNTEKYITFDDQMWFVGLADALKLIIPQYIAKTEFLAPNYGARYTRIIPGSRQPEIYSNAQEVCEEGGFVILYCGKYTAGHILLATNVKKNGRATIIDSRSERAFHDGRALENVILKNYYAQNQDPQNMGLGLQPEFYNIIGVYPKLSARRIIFKSPDNKILNR